MAEQNQDKRPTANKPTDYRKLRKEGERRTLYLILFVLIVVGDLLIGLVFGWTVMLSALPWLVLFGCGIAVLFWAFDAMDRGSH